MYRSFEFGLGAHLECPPVACAAAVFLRPPGEPCSPWSWLSSLACWPPILSAPTGLSRLHAEVEAAGGPGFGDGFTRPSGSQKMKWGRQNPRAGRLVAGHVVLLAVGPGPAVGPVEAAMHTFREPELPAAALTLSGASPLGEAGPPALGGLM